MAYDAPLLKNKFSERLEIMKKELATKDQSVVKYHEHYVCTSKAHLDKELKRILAENGEGLMIKDPNCTYEGKRSKKLLKVKVF